MSDATIIESDSPDWPPDTTWAEWFANFYRQALEWARKPLAGDFALAQDAVQDAAEDCYEKQRQDECVTQGEFLGAIRKKSIDIIRKRNRKSVTLVFSASPSKSAEKDVLSDSVETTADEGPTPAEAASSACLEERRMALLDEMLRTLKPEDRELIEQHHLKGVSQAEIAKQRATTENAVKCKLLRLRAQLCRDYGSRFSELEF